ncbi:hypothetical protein BGZ93_000560 [Podila epicladia]|nr:hypothetical protein BGZ92_001735 [Podila epicladia]KAG0100472.1 hypothetical protein BGZ93_000560 [Podila epicladia]
MSPTTRSATRARIGNGDPWSNKIHPQDIRQGSPGSHPTRPQPSFIQAPGPNNRVSVVQGTMPLKAIKPKPDNKHLLKATEALKALKLGSDNKPSVEQAAFALNKLHIYWRPCSTASLMRAVVAQRGVKADIGYPSVVLKTTVPCARTQDPGMSPMQRAVALMRDACTMNYAFVFKCPGMDRQVTLWVHQFQLGRNSDRFQELYRFVLESDAPLLASRYNMHFAQAPGHYFVPYCALVRYLYTGQVQFEVDLREYMITDWPVTSPVQAPEQSADLRRLLAEPVKKVLPADLAKLADRYRLKELQELF